MREVQLFDGELGARAVQGLGLDHVEGALPQRETRGASGVLSHHAAVDALRRVRQATNGKAQDGPGREPGDNRRTGGLITTQLSVKF